MSVLLFAVLSVLALDLSPLFSLLDAGFCVDMPSRTVGSCFFELCWVDVARLPIPLAYIPVTQGGSTGWMCFGGELAIEDVLWNAAVVYPAYVSKPVQAPLREDGEHA